MNEEFRDIPGYPGYQASNLGRIRGKKGTILAPINNRGYPFVNPSLNGKQVPVGIHRLVCMAFHGPPPQGHECAHLDGNPANCRWDNLKWVTRLENQHHRYEHGTTLRGERGSNVKITLEQAKQVKARIGAGETSRQVAEDFGISQGHAHNIASGRRWPELR